MSRTCEGQRHGLIQHLEHLGVPDPTSLAGFKSAFCRRNPAVAPSASDDLSRSRSVVRGIILAGEQDRWAAWVEKREMLWLLANGGQK